MRPLATLVTALLVTLSPCHLVTLSAEEWSGWRGPRGDGTSREVGVPLKWGPKENVRWKVAIPGVGHSSPVIWGDRIFVTTCIEDEAPRGKKLDKKAPRYGKRVLLCLDRRDGSVLWQRTVLSSVLERKHSLNSFSSGTPVTDGKHVWVAFLDYPDMRVFCYDVAGNKVWEKSPGKLLSVHGFCTSPVLHKGLVILNGDQDAKAYLVALDKKTGAERWRADRPNRTRSYCTPILLPDPKRAGATQLILSGSKCVTGYDADTGALLWLHRGPTEQYVASLVHLDGVLFLTTGFPQRHLMGLSPEGQGDITGTKHVLWHIPHTVNRERGAAYVPSPIGHDGNFFVVSDPGYLSCVDAKLGKRRWMEKLGRRHSASPVLVQGHLIVPDDDGITWVVKASLKFEVVHKNALGEPIYASPAVSRGQLFLRGERHLYCIGNGAGR
jgi:outer membrane protein assembly factor BamB